MEVTNTGPVTGDVVLQAFFIPKSGPATQGHNPLRKQLFDYTRLNGIDANAKAIASFTFDVAALGITEDESGDIAAVASTFDLLFTDGSGASQGQFKLSAELKGDTHVIEPFPKA